ncbi:MAG: 50S ribosomal protein L25 [Fimbriimonadales bacterium]
MRYQTIQVKPRESGKKVVEGDLPIALSRGGKDTVSFAASSGTVQGAVRKSGVGGIMELVEDGGESHLGMLKELQWHPVSRKLQHASFQEVKRNQEVNTTVPIVIVGEPASVADRTGQFLRNSDSIELHAKVSALPDNVTIDVSGMVVGDVLTAGAVPLPDGCRAANADSVICSVTTPTVVEIETPTAETDALGGAAAGEGTDQQSAPQEESSAE